MLIKLIILGIVIYVLFFSVAFSKILPVESLSEYKNGYVVGVYENYIQVSEYKTGYNIKCKHPRIYIPSLHDFVSCKSLDTMNRDFNNNQKFTGN
jgi:hypothetical protein